MNINSVNHGFGAVGQPAPAIVSDGFGSLRQARPIIVVSHGFGAAEGAQDVQVVVPLEPAGNPHGIGEPFPTWIDDGSGFKRVAPECIAGGPERIEVPGEFSDAKHGVFKFVLTDGRTLLRPDSYAGSDVVIGDGEPLVVPA